MIKKIIFICLMSVFLFSFSCGKKGCPKINEDQPCNELFTN
jgi:hypothetical protein